VLVPQGGKVKTPLVKERAVYRASLLMCDAEISLPHAVVVQQLSPVPESTMRPFSIT
jgi:hypothetical protein